MGFVPAFPGLASCARTRPLYPSGRVDALAAGIGLLAPKDNLITRNRRIGLTDRKFYRSILRQPMEIKSHTDSEGTAPAPAGVCYGATDPVVSDDLYPVLQRLELKGWIEEPARYPQVTRAVARIMAFG